MGKITTWCLILGLTLLATVGPVVAQSGSGEGFDVEAATQEYLSRMSPEERARSDAYFEGGYWLQLWGFLYTLGVAWLLLGTGLSGRIRDRAEKWTRRRPLQTAIYTAFYLVITTILFFPLSVYQQFFREHQYDLATQTFPEWMRDFSVDLGLSVVLLPLLFIALYGVFRRAPKTWWLWGSVVGLGFLAFLILIAPVFIDPLFNTYEPLEDPAIKEPILAMARENGIEVDNVFQFDASRQSNRVSANVSGFLGTMAIRLNDNLLNRCSLAEIKEVMAHEIGHYVLNHIYELLIVFGLILVGGFGFVRWAFDRVVAKWGQSWSVRGIGDIAGLPLLTALFATYFFIMTPFVNTTIRVNEAEADLFALHAAREPDGAAEVALKLSEYRKMDPGPIEEWIFFDHPSGRARIHMAMTWKAENMPAEPVVSEPVDDDGM
jgi:STE24 endopeptidase